MTIIIKQEKGLDKLLSVGKVLNFQGIKGEVKVGFTGGNEKIFSEINEIYVVKDSEIKKLDIEKVRFHKNFAIIKFKQINSINDTVKIKGSLLKLPKEKLDKYLNEDEFYISDLVNLKAYDTEGNFLGNVSGVVNIKEQDTLFIKDKDNKECMVPFKKEFVPEVNLKEGKIIINKIEGLF